MDGKMNNILGTSGSKRKHELIADNAGESDNEDVDYTSIPVQSTQLQKLDRKVIVHWLSYDNIVVHFFNSLQPESSTISHDSIKVHNKHHVPAAVSAGLTGSMSHSWKLRNEQGGPMAGLTFVVGANKSSLQAGKVSSIHSGLYEQSCRLLICVYCRVLVPKLHWMVSALKMPKKWASSWCSRWLKVSLRIIVHSDFITVVWTIIKLFCTSMYHSQGRGNQGFRIMSSVDSRDCCPIPKGSSKGRPSVLLLMANIYCTSLTVCIVIHIGVRSSTGSTWIQGHGCLFVEFIGLLPQNSEAFDCAQRTIGDN